ncbi:hypothetical protein [Paraclostridium sordellii]|uniref:hypothetical protein n=1 Tax=Paraclostridium sordellii TaxID=1505 RepID=UPI0013151D4B|nr:hypothetical protein [Paeniclostridium sordellii]MDU5019084.1 hypothetical protein [Clostridiales bacterium]
MEYELKHDLKKLINIATEIEKKTDDAASQASYVDTNTSSTNEKLDKIIRLLEQIVENQ